MDAERIDPQRPDPDVLLAQLKREEAPTRGRLRVYLGMAPGVGKTYAMLNEARRRLERRSADVVVGYVETYGRPLTVTALEGLEVVPRRQVTYRGVTLEEMDVDAIIARKPDVVLVDELAHTNAPGSKHEKRWQDVEEIRDHDISVIATLNIQHLESLNETVENLTGIKVRETVPDWVLDQADEVELIDMSPEALRARLRHGNIYPPGQAAAASENFFKLENLAALRRLALQRTMEEVEDRVEEYMRDLRLEEWHPSERIMACITERPATKTVLRRAWRLASALHGELIAVYVDRGKKLDENARLNVEGYLRLAEDLGARVERREGKHIAETLAECARAEHTTQVVMSHSARSRWDVLRKGSVINRLIDLLPETDIHIIAERREQDS